MSHNSDIPNFHDEIDAFCRLSLRSPGTVNTSSAVITSSVTKAQPAQVILGSIMDAVAGAYTYTVSAPDAHMPLECTDMNVAGAHPWGPRRFTMYAPGTPVIVLWAPGDTTGIILGAFPTATFQPTAATPGYILPATGTGLHNDTVHNYRMKMDHVGGINVHNINRPTEAIPGSDSGEINELNVGYGISRWFSWMRGSDLSALYCFYPDHLVRQISYNYERWGAGGEFWSKNDQLENNEVDLFTPYPWEAMGFLDYGIPATEIKPDGGKAMKAQYDTWHVPLKPDQVQLVRHMVMRGYLADVVKEMVIVPEKGKVGEPETLAEQSIYTGLLDIQKQVDGFYSVRSARGISLAKYIFLPVPKMISRPEGERKTALGDNDTNYRFSSMEGGGPVHEKKEYDWSSKSDHALSWYAEMFDFHAYMFNWYGVRPLYEHKKDWYFPDEAIEEGPGTGVVEGSYVFKNSLKTEFLFKLPDVATVKIDHRQTSAKYYFSRAAIDIMPDGSILIEDGYGSSIHMTGGSIFQSCAGDVWTLAGRSATTWAGDDICQRAGSSVDVTASKGDVRIKAENHLHALAGNSGEGGLLLECRAIGDTFNFVGVQGEDVIHSGITLKARSSAILAYGAELYLRSMDGGSITVDADKGLGSLLMIAQDHSRWATTFFADIAGNSPYIKPAPTINDASVSLFTRDVHTIGGARSLHCASPFVTFSRPRGDVTLMTDGQIIGSNLLIERGAVIGDALLVDGAIISTSSIFGGVSSPGVPGTVLAPTMMLPSPIPFPPILIPPMRTLIELTATGYDILHTAVLSNTPLVNSVLYANPSGWGNDSLLIDPIQFSLRSVEQYGLEEFYLVEPRWQSMYRRTPGAADKQAMIEMPVFSNGLETYPNPGLENWKAKPSLVLLEDTKFWDWGMKANKPRAPGPYDDAKSHVPEDRILDGSWIVSKQKE